VGHLQSAQEGTVGCGRDIAARIQETNLEDLRFNLVDVSWMIIAIVDEKEPGVPV